MYKIPANVFQARHVNKKRGELSGFSSEKRFRSRLRLTPDLYILAQNPFE
jgi:hypothetical protein